MNTFDINKSKEVYNKVVSFETSKIKNTGKLAVNSLRKSAVEIVEEGLWAIDTEQNVLNRVSLRGDDLVIDNNIYSLKGIERLFLVGVGKCSMEAALGLEKLLGERIADGIVVDLTCRVAPKRVKFCQGNHPFPTENNVGITGNIIKMLKDCTEKDLVIFIVSGGGSTLLCQPSNFTCYQESDMLACLIGEGADIYELNTVRKHLSLARGGFLAQYAYPARSISLVFSDVDDDMEFVASGPTFRDSTTIEEARSIILKYKAHETCGFNLNNLIETPKDKKYFENAQHVLFISVSTALSRMITKAQELGFKPELKSANLKGEAKFVGVDIMNQINNAGPKTAHIYGGETTVVVRVVGKGGRNQELVLSALRTVGEGSLIAAVNSDGWDNTEFAGALGDSLTKEKASNLGLDPGDFLERNQSFSFFEKVGDCFKTGLTGSNVADIIVALKE